MLPMPRRIWYLACEKQAVQAVLKLMLTRPGGGTATSSNATNKTARVEAHMMPPPAPPPLAWSSEGITRSYQACSEWAGPGTAAGGGGWTAGTWLALKREAYG